MVLKMTKFSFTLLFGLAMSVCAWSQEAYQRSTPAADNPARDANAKKEVISKLQACLDQLFAEGKIPEGKKMEVTQSGKIITYDPNGATPDDILDFKKKSEVDLAARSCAYEDTAMTEDELKGKLIEKLPSGVYDDQIPLCKAYTDLLSQVSLEDLGEFKPLKLAAAERDLNNNSANGQVDQASISGDESR